jgi:hypothetical protein
MLYGSKPVDQLSNQELTDASFTIAAMRKKFEDATNDPRYADRFNNQPERVMNSNFLELEKAVIAELKNRNM